MSTQRQRSRGVSLIEALVALAVMAFGLLGVMGMQATLRGNADTSRQRAEAVRFAQAALEDWRSFNSLTADAGAADYADIVDILAQTLPGINVNATFQLTAGVLPSTVGASDPKLKTVRMRVDWEDRSGKPASVTLVSSIAGVSPALAGTLSLPADRAATQRPLGRKTSIPVAAVDQGNGTSRFTPPGAATGVSWVFNNTTGFITTICLELQPCLTADYLLLSGYVRFATGAAPTPETPELPQPTGLVPTIGVKVVLTAPAAATVRCYTQASSFYTAYYCAVPVGNERKWSGQSLVDLPGALPSQDPTTHGYRVCRYTPEASQTPTGGNAAHPLVYTDASVSLANQNFLMLDLAYACPGDGPSELSNSTTFAHQPSS